MHIYISIYLYIYIHIYICSFSTIRWTPEEDSRLLSLMQAQSKVRWSVVGGDMEGRSGKQCRERWHNHLSPEVSQKINRSHAHAHDSRTNHSHEHRASNGATTLKSRSRRERS